MERRGWDSSPRCGSSYNGLRVLDGVPGPASGPLQHRSPGFCGAGPPVGPDNRIRSCTHKSRLVGSGWSMSALPPKADIRQRGLTSRLVPTADSSCAGGDPRTPKIFGATNSASLPPGPYDGPPSKLAPRTSPSLDRQGGRCRRPRQAWGRRHPFDKSPRTPIPDSIQRCRGCRSAQRQGSRCASMTTWLPMRSFGKYRGVRNGSVLRQSVLPSVSSSRPSLAESKNSFELSPIYTTPLSIEGMIAFVPRLIMQLSGARWGRRNGHVSSRARF
jgi:hypothetical protein